VKRTASIFFAAFLLAISLRVGAADQSQEFDLTYVSPAMDPFGFVYTEGADNFAKDYQFYTGVKMSVLHAPLVIEELEGADDSFNQRYLVKDALKFDLYGSVRLHDLVGVGLLLPVTMYQSGDNLAINKDLTHVALGDMRIRAKFTPFPFLYSREKLEGLSVALMEELILPTGARQGFTSDGFVGNELTFVADYRWKFIHAGFNFSWRAREREKFFSGEGIPGQYTDDTLNYKFALGANIGEIIKSKTLDSLEIMTELVGSTVADDAFHYQYQNPIEQVFSARYNLYRLIGMDIILDAGFGVGYNAGMGAPSVRWFAGASYATLWHDDDGDGIANDKDKCPDDPEDFDKFEDSDGCLEPDNDQDGVCDPWVTENNQLDKYKDVCKGVDKCPTEKGYGSEDGCPNPDFDKDGICDAWVTESAQFEKYIKVCRGIDKCPYDPGFGSDDGCPTPDKDMDGICDQWVTNEKLLDKFKNICIGVDKCPVDPFYAAEDGCIDFKNKNIVGVNGTNVEMKGEIEFEGKNAVIKRSSFKLLNQMARLLRGHWNFIEVEIAVYTDAAGTGDKARDKNLEISRLRADAVKEYLVNNGLVDADKLKTVGYGYVAPSALASNPLLKEKANRVEFKVRKINNKGKWVIDKRPGKDAPKEQPKEQPKETPKETPKEPPKEHPNQNTNEKPKEQPK